MPYTLCKHCLQGYTLEKLLGNHLSMGCAEITTCRPCMPKKEDGYGKWYGHGKFHICHILLGPRDKTSPHHSLYSCAHLAIVCSCTNTAGSIIVLEYYSV